MIETATTPVTSLAPRESSYSARTNFIATHLGRQISDCRGTETISATATRVLAEHGAQLTHADALRIGELIRLDTEYDSEERMATRAAQVVLHEVFGDTMQVVGWMDGRRVVVRREVYTTLNEACPLCEVNPLCHGAGGGVRCLNAYECGYSYCA